MFLDDIFERNRGWVRGRQPQPLPPASTMRLAVVGCYDPRLDQLLLPALGLQPGDAFLLRSAGALLQPNSTSMRSLGLAIYMFGVTEVLIVGHAACRMAMFDSAAFIEEFRRRGVPRDAFGDESLRTWAGAIASPRQGVLQSVAAVRSAPFVPKDVRVAGVVLDETTGALELVVGPDQAIEGAGAVIQPIQMRPTMAGSGSPSAAESSAAREAARSQSAVARSGDAEAAETARAGAAAAAPATSPSGRDKDGRLTKARQRAARAAAPSAPPPPPPGAPPSRIAQTKAMLEAVDEFLTQIQGKEHLRADLENLRDELERRHDPRQRLELLDAFGRRLSSESREVSEAFKKLRRQIGAGGADPTAQLLSIFQYLGGRQ